MFKSRFLSASLSLLVGVSVLAPWAAGAAPAPDPAWEANVEAAQTDGAAGPAAAAATPEAAPAQGAEAARKPKGNAFVRALSAPFRALARLFGGGDRKGETAKKRPAPTAVEEARTPAPPAARPEPARAAALPAAPELSGGLAQAGQIAHTAPVFQRGPVISAGPVIPPSTVAPAGPVTPAGPVSQSPTAEAGARVVRPGETPAASVLPRRFVPVIEGVGRDPLSQGRALLQNGYLSEAVSELSVAATAFGPGSNLVEANNLLGLAFDRLGSHREAAEAYRRALTVAPADPVVLANLGYSLYLSNDFDGALRHLRQAARVSPSLGVVHNNIGIVQARLGNYDEAFRSFARATNQFDAHLKLAGIHEAEKRDRQAVKHYEAALRLEPNTSAVLERLVAVYERTGQRGKAESARRALGQPSNPQRTNTGGGG